MQFLPSPACLGGTWQLTFPWSYQLWLWAAQNWCLDSFGEPHTLEKAQQRSHLVECQAPPLTLAGRGLGVGKPPLPVSGSDWLTLFPVYALTRAQGEAQQDQRALMRKEVGRQGTRQACSDWARRRPGPEEGYPGTLAWGERGSGYERGPGKLSGL